MTEGIVFDILRFSLNDGPGIRTSVFLKGCPLKCLWCHNPESHSFQPEESAKKLYGRIMNAVQVIEEVAKDIKYYEKSGGGITISGGEPLAQPEFTLEILKAAKDRGIHTCIETSGHAAKAIFTRILPYVDLFLFDYKATGSEKHKELTGVSNELILGNLDYIYNEGAAIVLRCPMIPGVNDSMDHFQAIADLNIKYPNLKGIELLPYHDFGRGKYSELGRDYSLSHLKNTAEEQKESWLSQLASLGCKNVN
jgi:pyruvate formate lyase activating enzyme